MTIIMVTLCFIGFIIAVPVIALILNIDNRFNSARQITEIPNKPHKKVLTNGCFSKIDTWHIKYLKEVANYGDVTVLVNDNKSIKNLKGYENVAPAEERKKELEKTGVKVIIYDGNLEPYLKGVDIYVKGGDYTLETINQKERKMLEERGIEIRFSNKYSKVAKILTNI